VDFEIRKIQFLLNLAETDCSSWPREIHWYNNRAMYFDTVQMQSLETR